MKSNSLLDRTHGSGFADDGITRDQMAVVLEKCISVVLFCGRLKAESASSCKPRRGLPVDFFSQVTQSARKLTK